MATQRFLYTWVTVVYRCLISLIGIPGNILILSVYWDKQALGSAQVFIQALALSDLFVCSLFPLEIHFWLFEFDYTDQFLCKIFFTSTSIGFYLSICITVSIALDRYLAVAKPVNGRWSREKAQRISIFCVFLAVFINSAVPFSSHLGHKEVKGFLNGTTCYKQQSENRSLIYYVVTIPQYLTTFASFIIIGVLYFKLWMAVARQRKKISIHEVKYDDTSVAPNEYTQTSAVEPSVTVVKSTSDTTHPVLNAANGVSADTIQATPLENRENPSMTAARRTKESALQSGHISDNMTEQGAQNELIETGKALDCRPSLSKGEDKSRRNEDQETGGSDQSATSEVRGSSVHAKTGKMQNNRGKRQSAVSRLTVMLLLATAIFFFTWLITLVTFGLTPVTRKFFGNNIGYTVVAVLRLSSLINHAINPLLYSFLNPRFRADCRMLFKRLKSKLL